MERKIAFRGKSRYRKEWLYGNLVQYKDGSFGIDGVPVETDSVGQFTGLCDKDGREIYEGDVLCSPLGNVVIVKFGYKEHVVKHDIFTDSFAAYGWIVENVKNGITDFLDNEFLQGEVIGNIHDNPSLISDKQ